MSEIAVFSAISSGRHYLCGLLENGAVSCWGERETSCGTCPPEGAFSALSSGKRRACALRTDGSAFCQGNDSHGQASPPATVFAQIAAGERQTCGITPEGGLERWGIAPYRTTRRSSRPSASVTGEPAS